MSASSSWGRLVRGAVAAAIGAAATLSFAAAPSSAETTLERVKREGYIRVGFANEPPFGFATATGTIAGEALSE